jgi:7-cyano-7-deazaguanine synthase
MATTADQRKAVILLSGGLDSATCLAIARSLNYSLYAISFCYGQRHQFELQQAKKFAESFQVLRHVVVNIDLAQFGGSALTTDIAVPKGRSDDAMSQGIPITYVPARNTVFLSLALAWAETLDSTDIFIGVNALDYSGYPDCRPEFIAAFQNLANIATKAGVSGEHPMTIHAPLLHLSKREIVKLGIELGVDYSITSSCYDPSPDGLACGDCDACQLRLRGFGENGLKDPAAYSTAQ